MSALGQIAGNARQLEVRPPIRSSALQRHHMVDVKFVREPCSAICASAPLQLGQFTNQRYPLRCLARSLVRADLLAVFSSPRPLQGRRLSRVGFAPLPRLFEDMLAICQVVRVLPDARSFRAGALRYCPLCHCSGKPRFASGPLLGLSTFCCAAVLLAGSVRIGQAPRLDRSAVFFPMLSPPLRAGDAIAFSLVHPNQKPEMPDRRNAPTSGQKLRRKICEEKMVDRDVLKPAIEFGRRFCPRPRRARVLHARGHPRSDHGAASGRHVSVAADQVSANPH